MFCQRCTREIEDAEPEARPELPSLNLLDLPHVPIADYLHLPRISAVYFALAAPKICYVGTAQDIAQRWRHHHQLARLQAEPNGRIAWVVLSDKTLCRALEKEAIRYFKPLWNNTGAEYLNHRQTNERFPDRATIKQQELERMAFRGDIQQPGYSDIQNPG